MADKDSRKGISYISNEIVSYLEDIHSPHDEHLARAFDAPGEHGMPEIQVGPSEGKLLNLLLKLIGARKVIEVGTLAAYSTIWMARALPPEGTIWSIESESMHAEVARKNIEAAGLTDKVVILVGKATDVLPDLEKDGPFDAVFLDADKGGYAGYAKWAAENIRHGGLLLADNAFFFGRLMGDEDDAASVRKMHENASEHFDAVTIGTGDGLFMGIRR